MNGHMALPQFLGVAHCTGVILQGQVARGADDHRTQPNRHKSDIIPNLLLTGRTRANRTHPLSM